jgi:hypothetical protein
MGYVNVTDISQFVSPLEITKIAGTWTPTISSNLISDVRTAAAADTTLLIPIPLPGSSVGTQAAKLKSIDVWYKIATAEPTGFTVVLNRVALNADGVAVAGANITAITLDSNHDTPAKRYAIENHKMTVSLDAETFITEGYAYWLSCVISCHLNTVLTLFGARANYTLRL